MNGRDGDRGAEESGFTLVELLAAIGIVGVIGFGLMSAMIMTVKTTDGTIDRVTSAVATDLLSSFFSADVQSAEKVSGTDSQCASVPDDVILHLEWSDEGTTKMVSYALSPAGAEDQQLIRWSCNDGVSPPAERVLGQIRDEPGGPPSVSIQCDPDDSPDDTDPIRYPPEPDPLDPSQPESTCSSTPQTVTLRLRLDSATPQDLTVRLRTAPPVLTP